jgi:predicted esterase
MDPIVPRANTSRLASMLSTFGATVQMEWVRAAHGLTSEDVDLAREWLQKNS